MADVVVDTTVLIAFARLDRLHLLRRLYDHVFVPEAVRREATRSLDYPEVRLILASFDAGDLEILAAPQSPDDERVMGLGAGEAAVIAAAEEMGAVVVLDDARARRTARGLGLRVIGSVGVLMQARRRGLIPAVEPLLRELQAGGFRLGASEFEAALEEDGR